MIELNQYHASEYIKIIAYDSCKQILNSLQTIEVNLRSTAPNRQSIVYLWLYIGWEVKQMAEFFLNEETCEIIIIHFST